MHLVHRKEAELLEARVKTRVSIPESSGTLPITIPYRFLPASSRSFKCFSGTWKAIAPASPRADGRYLKPEIESRQSHRRPAGERGGCSWKSSSGHPVCERNGNCFPAYLASRRNAKRRLTKRRNSMENGNRISRKYSAPQFASNFRSREDRWMRKAVIRNRDYKLFVYLRQF